MDDPYFAERYKPTVWVSGEGMGWSKEAGLKAEKVLGKDGAPFPELIEPVIMSKDYLKVPVGLFPRFGFIHIVLVGFSRWVPTVLVVFYGSGGLQRYYWAFLLARFHTLPGGGLLARRSGTWAAHMGRVSLGCAA
eukprot:221294-Chlamydomonas_euryale.AAC.1